jgi:hypothetical protein
MSRSIFTTLHLLRKLLTDPNNLECLLLPSLFSFVLCNTSLLNQFVEKSGVNTIPEICGRVFSAASNTQAEKWVFLAAPVFTSYRHLMDISFYHRQVQVLWFLLRLPQARVRGGLANISQTLAGQQCALLKNAHALLELQVWPNLLIWEIWFWSHCCATLLT